MNIVIIGHNERKSIQKMLDSLIFNFPDANRIWVLDRCFDGSKRLLKSKGEFFVTTNFLFGRHTSSSRNLGESFTDKSKDVLFLDADRFIINDKKVRLNKTTDVELLLLKEDSRWDARGWFSDYSEIYGTVHNGFYSCGIFMKRDAIEKVKAFQGELFSTDIEKWWGIEDTYLGDVCYHLGLSCDINKEIVLNGKFSKTGLPLNTLEKRLAKRLDLNVRW